MLDPKKLIFNQKLHRTADHSDDPEACFLKAYWKEGGDWWATVFRQYGKEYETFRLTDLRPEHERRAGSGRRHNDHD